MTKVVSLMITKSDFYGYNLYTVTNGDMEVSFSTLGGIVTEIKFKDQTVSLGYDDVQGYMDSDEYMGAIVGRCANRTSGAAVTVNGVKYKLAANVGENMLHGGVENLPYNKRRWYAEVLGESSVRFTMRSPHLDNGFPGNLDIFTTYTVTGNSLRIDIEAQTDMDTYFAPAFHGYFNLDGSEKIFDHELQVNAASYVETQGEHIPTGRLLPCQSDMDFNAMRKIGHDYDKAFVLSDSHACTAKAGNIEMQLHTDFPSVQLYSGYAMSEKMGINHGFCLEPQFYPDSANRPEFPSTLLKAGENFHKFAEYRFF